jgi:predicted ATPase
VQVGILGPLDVRDARGRPIDVAGARLRTLVCRLALDPGRPVSVFALVEAVWGAHPPADEANALQTLVSRLRRALGDAAAVSQSGAGYRLEIAPEDVDVVRFEAMACEGAALARAGDPARAGVVLRAALELWRGPALADGGDGLRDVASRLTELRLAAIVDRVDADLATSAGGPPSALVSELEALVLDHPLNERLAGQLITALARAGRPADALQAYERLRAGLADELGVDPSAPVQAVQLAVLRGELAAPEPRQAARRTNLKAQLTSFIGRDDEVSRIVKALEEHRLVTLVGPGGAGKTRLASEAAATIVDSAADGIWLVELASVSDGADIPQTVLGSLGIREAHLLDRRVQLTARDAIGRLQESLADKDAMLILDNCEHLVDASARLADQLLAECPRLRVLATSREPLGIVGEVLLVVPPLGQPAPGAQPLDALEYPAVRLFADRAAAVRPHFQVDEATVGTVVEIVRRLDGLPLAIELAAARLRSLPLSDIAARLSDRFRLLTGGSRTALPRHRTLRAVVEWSWELLTPAERLLAERLSVFPAGATTASATTVCEDASVAAEDVPDLLASLVDKSLLQPVAAGPRLRMLETIREYGAERLVERGELRETRERHADYFARLVHDAEPHLISADQLPWFDLLTVERDNIMAALRFRCDQGDADGALALAVSAGGFAMLLGNHADVPLWLEEALAVPGGSDEMLRWVAEALYAMNSATTDPNADTVEQSLSRLKVSADQLAGVDLERHPLVGLLRPAAAHFAGNRELAERFIDEAVSGPHEWVAAAAVMFRAAIAENNGDVDGMRADAAWALSEFRRLGERWGTATTLRSMAHLHTLDRDLVAATAAYEEALAVMAQMNSRDDEVFLRVRMADLFMRRGDVAGAREQVRLAHESSEVTGSSIEIGYALCVLAGIEALAGNIADARRLHGEAKERLAAIPPGHPVQAHGRAMVLGISARLCVLEGDTASALEQARAGFAAALETQDMPVVASVGLVSAELTAAAGEHERAAQQLGAAAALRGAEDPTALDVRALTAALTQELGAAGFAAQYALGRNLAAAEAKALLAPG